RSVSSARPSCSSRKSGCPTPSSGTVRTGLTSTSWLPRGNLVLYVGAQRTYNKIERGNDPMATAEPLVVSYSRLKSWKFCQQEHYYKYVMRIEPRVKPLPLQRGKILDDLLNAYTRGEPWEPVLEQYERTYGRLFREERELYGDIIGDCRRIMEGYVRRWANDP